MLPCSLLHCILQAAGCMFEYAFFKMDGWLSTCLHTCSLCILACHVILVWEARRRNTSTMLEVYLSKAPTPIRCTISDLWCKDFLSGGVHSTLSLCFLYVAQTFWVKSMLICLRLIFSSPSTFVLYLCSRECCIKPSRETYKRKW